MRALVRRSGGVWLDEVPAPRIACDDDVLIEVILAGICRTDLYVARGTLPVAEPRILGHEFAGRVLEAGPAAGFAPGEPVAVIPIIACGACVGCAADQTCAEPGFLGVQADGAFAERIVLPARAVLRVPASMPARRAAYVEPVAAALAVLNAPLDRASRGLILGDNRIASLIGRILDLEGFSDVTAVPVSGAAGLEGVFDFVIETKATAPALEAMVALLRPGGLGVLKSRPAAAVPIDIARAVKKDVRLAAVSYGRFERAIELLCDSRLDVDDILGPTFALEDFERAFAAADAGDAAKLFLAISPSPASAAADTGVDLAHA
jgi:L-iditol 2-dehydrogenase